MNKARLLLLLFLPVFHLTYGQVASSVSFFSGDTLNGFDFSAAAAQAGADHLNAVELQNRMQSQQKNFVSGKYHLADHHVKRAGVTIPVVLSGSCNNIDFEAGNFTGWTGGYGYNANSDSALTITGTSIYTLGVGSAETSCSLQTIVNGGSGTDPYSGLPMIYPGAGGGAYSVRIGGENANVTATTSCVDQGGPASQAPGEYLQQSFAVAGTNAYFNYNYCVILNDGGHPAGQQPYFSVDVLDGSGHPITCLHYFACGVAGTPPAGFMTSAIQAPSSSAVYYSPWATNTVNLTAYIGQTVTIRFTASGCVNGGHFAYAYIDGSCTGAPTIACSAEGCLGQTTTLTAPSGGSTYSWSMIPNGPGITGSTTTASTTVNVAGKYQVNVVTPSGCSYVIDTTISFYPMPSLTTNSTNCTCSGFTNGTATATVSGGNAPYTYSWSPAPGSGQGTANATNLSPGTYTVTGTTTNGCATSGTVTITQPNALTAALVSSSNLTCNAVCTGAATVTASGGTGSYIYSWSPSGQTTAIVNSLCAGTYTCTVLDANNCPATQNVTITQPTSISANPSQVDESCYQGSNGGAMVSASGGTPGYTYLWSPSGGTGISINSVVAGTYSCTIKDASGCMVVQSFTITQPSTALAVAVAGVNATCNGCDGSASASVTGGTLPYTYSWTGTALATPTISALCPGIYSCSLTDAGGCQVSGSAGIQQTASPHITGTVTAPVSGAINSGWAYLVLFDTTHHRQPLIDSVQISNGRYTFTNAGMGADFLVYAIADAATYPHVVKAYSLHAPMWDSATVVHAGCATFDTANINMYEMAPMTGAGSLSGSVVQDAGFVARLTSSDPIVLTPGDPVPGLDVNLEQHPGGVIAHTTTNSAGYYHFGSVPPGNFEVMVDIPGLGMVSAYSRTVTSNQMFTNLNYMVDSTHIHPDSTLVTAVIQNSSALQNNLTIAPNPFKETLNISYELGQTSDVILEIYNMLGEKMSETIRTKQDPGQYIYTVSAAEAKLSEGVYTVQITFGGKTTTRKVVCLK
jgi:hypothetical protein